MLTSTVKDCGEEIQLVSSKRKALEWFNGHMQDGFVMSEYSAQSAFREYDEVAEGEVIGVHWHKERVW